MKTQLDVLFDVLRDDFVNSFYNISFTKDRINLQGKYSPENIACLCDILNLQPEDFTVGRMHIETQCYFKESKIYIRLT